MESTGLHNALFKAIRDGDLETVTNLLTKFGLGFRTSWCNGYRMLCEATLFNQTHIAKYLLDMGAFVNVDERSRKKFCKQFNASPLHYAAQSGEELVQEILSKGGDVHSRNVHGATPLHDAVRHNKLGCVETLLISNSDVNVTDNSGKTPLFLAIEFETDSESMINLLSKYGADANIYCETGLNALLIATLKHRTDTVKLLLSMGAEIEATDFHNRTGLHICTENNDEKLCLLFIDRGADLNYKDCRKKTPLHLASRYGYPNIVNILLAKGALVNCEDNEGSTPLHLSVFSTRGPDIARVLVQNGADVNFQNYKGNTPLHCAIEYKGELGGQGDYVIIYLENGADPNAINSFGYTPLHISTKFKDFESSSLLLLYGADVTKLSLEGSPATIAFKNASKFYHTDPSIFEKDPIIKHCYQLGIVDNCNKNLVGLEISNEILDHKHKYVLELLAIKKCNYNIFALLTKPETHTASLIRNNNLREYIHSKSCEEMWTCYHSMMLLKWKQAEARYKLLVRCQKFFDCLMKVLPEECISHLCVFLNNTDLQILSEC